MGGKGNAKEILAILDALLAADPWKQYFQDFQCPYGFYDTKDYNTWLAEAGFTAKRVELIPKDMRQQGKEDLAAWIRTTWLPYTDRIPDGLKERFVAEIVESYVKKHPIDAAGIVHVKMVRLEVEATIP
jgi:trans-aconitate methyltransferase